LRTKNALKLFSPSGSFLEFKQEDNTWRKEKLTTGLFIAKASSNLSEKWFCSICTIKRIKVMRYKAHIYYSITNVTINIISVKNYESAEYTDDWWLIQLVTGKQETGKQKVLNDLAWLKACLPCFIVRDGSRSRRLPRTIAGVPATML
jgi:hypothetical protein